MINGSFLSVLGYIEFMFKILSNLSIPIVDSLLNPNEKNHRILELSARLRFNIKNIVF